MAGNLRGWCVTSTLLDLTQGSFYPEQDPAPAIEGED